MKQPPSSSPRRERAVHNLFFINDISTSNRPLYPPRRKRAGRRGQSNCRPLACCHDKKPPTFFSDVIVLRACRMAHETTVADVAEKENAEGNRVACNERKIEFELVWQLQRQAPLQSGSADLSRSNCSFSFSTAGSTISSTARGRSHHGRTSIPQEPKPSVRSSSLSGNKRDQPDETQKASVKATTKATVKSSSPDQTR